jgi:acetoacetate decarboxylase
VTAPQINPGDIANWPLLKVVYRTDHDKIRDLLPPGIEPGVEPLVHVNIYNVPVKGEPEYGVSTKIPASFDGLPGFYGIGIGIDQESAIFISQEINGQPKFPCTTAFFREGDRVVARCTHAGYTFLEFEGDVTGAVDHPLDDASGDVEQNDWWIKVSRAVGNAEKQYDFPPHVVRVHSIEGLAHEATVDGVLTLRDSPWDPYTELLPMREQLSARLVTPISKHREITLAGPLDPIAFWPHADTIGGSRWPGDRGGPRFRH